MSDPTANAVSVGLLKSLYSRSILAVESEYSRTIRTSRTVQKHNTAIRRDLCFGVTARRRLSGDHVATYGDRRRFEVAVSRNLVWLGYNGNSNKRTNSRTIHTDTIDDSY